MFAEEIRRALRGTSRERLAELSAAVWKGYACGALAESEAQQLAEEIAAHKAVPPPRLAEPRHRVGSRPRSSASMERRRAWTAGGWMPPQLAAHFTMGEAAALAVIVREIATTGRCALPVGAIAGRAGVCATTVRNALREARKLALLAVEVRRVSYSRNLPNVVSIVSRELALWVRTRARVEGQGGWVQNSNAGHQPLISHLANQSPTARNRASRRAGKTHSVLPKPLAHAPGRVVRRTPEGGP